MKQILVQTIDGNATPSITGALKQIVPGEETVLCFAKGVYRCDSEGCTDKFVSLAHLTKDVKHILFDLENAENLTIDGCGAEFIFTSRMFPFFIRNGKNVSIRNLTIDFAFSRYCQGTLIACSEEGFELKIDRSVFSFSVDSQGHVIFHGGRDSYSTAGECPILLANSVFGRSPWDYIFAGDTLADKSHLPTHFIETDAVETPGGILFTYRPGSRKLHLPVNETLLFCYEPRANINILAEQSRNVHIENVNLYRGGGMGIVADHSEDITIENTRIEVRPGRQECRSTTADGMFFTQCKGQITVRGCTIRDTLDDALNIHGFYTRISAVEGPHTLRVEDAYKPHQGSLPFDNGDRLLLCSGIDQTFKQAATIRSFAFRQDGSYILEMNEDVSCATIGDTLENDTRAADFLFESNEVCCVPHCRISDNGHLVVRNNHFEKMQHIYCCDLLAFWFESGAVRDLTIENNVFVDVPWGHNGAYPIKICSSRMETSDVRNRNVNILNNRFINTDGRAAHVSRTDGVHFENNSVETLEGVEPFLLEDCTEVQLS